MEAIDPWSWYFEIPIVSRVYFTVSFLLTAGVGLDLVSPLSLYFNYRLIFEKGQIWRLVTNFFFFGMFGVNFLMHMYFLVRHSRMLEENSFRGRTADFLAFIGFGMVCMILLGPFINMPFFGFSLTFMMVYVWGRRNEHAMMSFFGVFTFRAPYLPWVLLLFSLVLGSSATVDLIGIVVGHIYFYLDDIYPDVAELRGWRRRRYLRVTELLRSSDDDIQVDLSGPTPNQGRALGAEWNIPAEPPAAANLANTLVEREVAMPQGNENTFPGAPSGPARETDAEPTNLGEMAWHTVAESDLNSATNSSEDGASTKNEEIDDNHLVEEQIVDQSIEVEGESEVKGEASVLRQRRIRTSSMADQEHHAENSSS